jgi:hypothetical protein
VTVMLVLMPEASVSLNWPRQLIGLITTICMVLVSFEVVIPDVHDGDFAAAYTTEGNAGTSLPAGDQDGIPYTSPPTPSHSQHVDHCTHMHGEGLPASTMFCLDTVEHPYRLVAPDRVPSDIHVGPHHRPPIA